MLVYTANAVDLISAAPLHLCFIYGFCLFPSQLLDKNSVDEFLLGDYCVLRNFSAGMVFL